MDGLTVNNFLKLCRHLRDAETQPLYESTNISMYVLEEYASNSLATIFIEVVKDFKCNAAEYYIGWRQIAHNLREKSWFNWK